MLLPLLLAVVGLAVLAFIGVVLWTLLRRRPEPTRAAVPDLKVDVASLGAAGPPGGALQLEYYGTPVRLAVLVLAPAGRDGAIPSQQQLPDLLDQLVPQLLQIVAEHQPLLRIWPRQLSSQGFANSFFHHVALPGDRGKDTPWCSAAGKFRAQGRQFLAGVVCCADQPNGLSHLAIEREAQWNDVLRVRS